MEEDLGGTPVVTTEDLGVPVVRIEEDLGGEEALVVLLVKGGRVEGGVLIGDVVVFAPPVVVLDSTFLLVELDSTFLLVELDSTFLLEVLDSTLLLEVLDSTFLLEDDSTFPVDEDFAGGEVEDFTCTVVVVAGLVDCTSLVFGGGGLLGG